MLTGIVVFTAASLLCAMAPSIWGFVALRVLGKDVTFYRFPAENHELSRSGSPVHRRMRGEIVLDWFTEQLAPR